MMLSAPSSPLTLWGRINIRRNNPEQEQKQPVTQSEANLGLMASEDALKIKFVSQENSGK